MRTCMLISSDILRFTPLSEGFYRTRWGFAPESPDTLYRNVPLAYYGAFQAPSLPIAGLQGLLGTQSVLAIPKGEPPAKAGFPLGSPFYIIMSSCAAGYY